MNLNKGKLRRLKKAFDKATARRRIGESSSDIAPIAKRYFSYLYEGKRRADEGRKDAFARLGKSLSEELYAAAQRPGFMRRFFEVQTRQPGDGFVHLTVLDANDAETFKEISQVRARSFKSKPCKRRLRTAGVWERVFALRDRDPFYQETVNE